MLLDWSRNYALYGSVLMNKLTCLLLLTAALALTSCSSIGKRQARPVADMFCPASAFIDRQAYEIEGPADKSQRALRLFTNELATKYPELLSSYDSLRECWDYYSGEGG